MYALTGTIDGNAIITNENLKAYDGRRVIITILDDMKDTSGISKQKSKDSSRRAAARELAGMWKTYNADVSVEDTVRNLRKGRQFDICYRCADMVPERK